MYFKQEIWIYPVKRGGSHPEKQIVITSNFFINSNTRDHKIGFLFMVMDYSRNTVYHQKNEM